MNCIRINSCHPVCSLNASRVSPTAPKGPSKLTLSSSHLGTRLPKISLNVKARTAVCLFGGKEKGSSNNEASPWKALEKAMGSLKKEPSVEDLLKQQIKKQEYYEGESGGGDLPGGGSGGSGGGGGGGGGFGGSEDESLSGILNELVQVILATLGFIFLYMYIIEGEEITVFAKDILKFIFLRQKSLRLRRTMARWESYFRSLTEKKEEDPYWLEREILNTTTWYDGPAKYRRILRELDETSYY